MNQTDLSASLKCIMNNEGFALAGEAFYNKKFV